MHNSSSPSSPNLHHLTIKTYRHQVHINQSTHSSHPIVKMDTNEIVCSSLNDGSENGAFSLLEGEDPFFGKIISRDTSQGLSSRIYYRATAQVPFQWELQPGTPKVLETETLPPLSPPPAVISMYLAPGPVAKSKERKRPWFWKKKGKTEKSSSETDAQSETAGSIALERMDSSELSSSGRDSTSSPRYSSVSSSSSSLFRCPSPGYPRSKSNEVEGQVWFFSCTPWHVRRSMACTSRF